MTYKVIGDSCLDLTENMKKDPRFQITPLTLQVGSAQVVDGETFDQRQFIETVKAYPECPKIACPSPEAFKAASEEVEAGAVSVITLSSYFSGSYNSTAMIKKLYEEEMAEKGMAEQARKVAVIDSLSTSLGELNVTLLIQNLCNSGLEFDEVAEKTLAYRGGTDTYFVLESLDTLHKNGRLSGLQAFFAAAPNIKPAMGADIGIIIELDQARGMNKVLQRTCDITIEEVTDATNKIAVVCHIDNPERTEHVEGGLARRVGFKKIVVTNVVGMTAIYANDGGIVLAV